MTERKTAVCDKETASCVCRMGAYDVAQIFRRFQEQNADPASELVWSTPFTLLVSVVLSAQATDKSVNLATPALFACAATPAAMAQLGAEGIEPFIRKIGLYHAKARHIAALSQMLVTDYGGKVPHTREELMTLPGVGRKTANVVLNVAFGENTMPVDTHVARVAQRIGLAAGKPIDIENTLLQIIPPEYMHNAHHWLLLHGRYICTARAPKCGGCIVRGLCRTAKNA